MSEVTLVRGLDGATLVEVDQPEVQALKTALQEKGADVDDFVLRYITRSPSGVAYKSVFPEDS